MSPRPRPPWECLILVLLLPLLRADPVFRAGAQVTDISPTNFPVVVNGMFTERSADRVVDPLFAKALVLDDGSHRIALCVVDSCMVPRDLIDQAKAIASRATGIARDHILISSTHTHSAPSAMGCLGSRVDPRYAAFLPARLADSIIGAHRRLTPARVAWGGTNDWKHTFNRRWIRRPDRLLTDPFGNPTVRAHMHPGNVSPDAVGPSGPVDPALTLLAISHPDGRPLAVLANYSQHYYGSPLLSSDYYGRFAHHLATSLEADPSFVAIMSQGTSGDLMWMDYGVPARDVGYETYAREMAAQVEAVHRRLAWHDHAPIRMAEEKLSLRYRTPDADRLAWARQLTAAVGDRLPGTLPEIYAAEALHLHERQQTELVLQAIRIGDLGIATFPNEVYALTGLKVKSASPLPVTMNISLANGAEGYIPPPEQHHLGGYTTWPARTAGLEVAAEPRIVETLVTLLEKVSGEPRRPDIDPHGPYPQAVLESRPTAYWRLNEQAMPAARDASPNGHHATLEPGFALHLPGPGSGTGLSPDPALTPSNFSRDRINRAVHFAGGRLRLPVRTGRDYTVSFWLWNGLPHDARPVTGYLFSHGPDAVAGAPGEHLGIGGTHRPDLVGRLFLFNGNRLDEILPGQTVLSPRAWHHVALVRTGDRFRVHLDGHPVPEIDGSFRHLAPDAPRDLFVGGRSDGFAGLEGRVDEVAWHDRALSPDEIHGLFLTAGLTPVTGPRPTPPASPGAVSHPPDQPPLSPAESLARIRVLPGYRIETVAAEPLVLDPVAIDWDPAGNLWVAEMADYPLGLDGQGTPGGRVRVLRDTDGDGFPDRSEMFADGLRFPTGILTWRDGVLVTAAPEILWLRDTDGDGRMDRREVLVTGLLEGNQQLRANGLRWGLDNRVHCAAGGHHPGHGTGTRLRTRQGEFAVGSRDFHFDPDTGELAPESGPSQFGRNRDDWGNWFGTQNIRPLWHYVLADRYLSRNPHVASPNPTHLVVTPLSPVVHPVSPPERRYHSFNEAGHFTSACSGMILRDPLLFPDDNIRHAFTCEPFHNLVQHNLVLDDGTSFTARRAPGEDGREFFASSDRWCRPVMTRTGPDGALWVVDMYRYMIEHPEWLPAEGRADLLPHYRLGEDRGRIYRILPEGTAPRPVPRLDTASSATLADALRSPNGWVRDKAHQCLLWKADRGVVPDLASLASTSNAPPLARLHALCILDGLQALTAPVIAAALGSPEPGLRIQALRLAEKHPALAAVAARLADDPSPKVRLQLACSLGEWNHPEAGRALARIALRDHADPFLRAAVLSAAAPHAGVLCDALADAGAEARRSLTGPLAQLALGLGQPALLARILSPVLDPDPEFHAAQAEEFTGLLDILDRRQVPLGSLHGQDPRLDTLLDRVPRLLDWARHRAPVDSHGTDSADRITAGTLLARHPSTRREAVPVLIGWLTPGRPNDLQIAALRNLGRIDEPAIAGALVESWPGWTPAVREVGLDVLFSRESWTLAWLDHAIGGDGAPPDARRRDQLLRHPSATVRQKAGEWLGTPRPRAEVIARFQPALDLPDADHRAGYGIWLARCSACHVFDGEGRAIGPDVVTFASHAPGKILANLIDPGADIQPGFSTYTGRMRDGTPFTALIESESGNSLTLRLADGTRQTLLRSEIAELADTGRSLMPDGLEAGLGLREMADLIAFLRHPRRPPPDGR